MSCGGRAMVDALHTVGEACSVNLLASGQSLIFSASLLDQNSPLHRPVHLCRHKHCPRDCVQPTACRSNSRSGSHFACLNDKQHTHMCDR